VFERLAGAEAPVEFTAYDGSRAGVPGADIRFHVSSPYAVSYLLHSPGALGLARAYVTGMIDVSGDMITALTTMQQVLQEVTTRDKVRILGGVLGDPLLRAAITRRLDPPPQEAPFSRIPSWLRHTKRRDAKAISHHYDVSNTFYEWVLGPSMAYTCACYPREDATLEAAQYNKHDLVAKKLGLKPGRHGDARREGVRRPGARRHAVQAAGGVGAEGHRGPGPVRPRGGPSPGLPRRHRDGFRRDQLHRPHRAHRQGEPARVLLVPIREAAQGRSDAEPHHHASGQHGPAPQGERVHQPLR